jgi:hypothetical protein
MQGVLEAIKMRRPDEREVLETGLLLGVPGREMVIAFRFGLIVEVVLFYSKTGERSL